MPATRQRHNRRTLSAEDREAISMLVGAAAMLLQTTGELDSYFSGWFDTTPQEARERAAVAVARVEHFLWPSVHPKPERST